MTLPAQKPVKLYRPLRRRQSTSVPPVTAVAADRRVHARVRPSTDSPRIKESRAVAVVAIKIECEVARSFDEKRAALGKKRLERAEIHDSRIGLDLAEIRIDRAGECQSARDLVFEIEAGAAVRIRRFRQRISAGDGRRRQLRDGVRRK